MIRRKLEEYLNRIGTLQTPAPFWFWNDKIEDQEISRQMEMMKSAGVEQPIIHARSGLLVDYLSEEWFAHIDHALKEAQALGMHIWLYDENNWPSGTCNGIIPQTRDYREHFLFIEEKDLLPGERLQLSAKPEYIEQYTVVNVTVYQEGKEAGENITQRASEFVAAVPCRAYIVSVAINIYEEFGYRSVNYLNHDAIATFVRLTHEQYKKHFAGQFGQVIEGIFMDETRFLNALPWCQDFPEEFRKRKGYDILPLLHLLYRKEKMSGFVRCDYFDVVAQLLVENTFRQLYDWSEQNHMKSIGHVLGEETLAAQSRFNADIMRLFRYMHIPGIDHLDNGIGSLNAKICSSAAHNYGKLIVTSESFGAAGWDMTFEEMVKINNWLFQQGINLIIIHAFYYSIREERSEDWPPSYFHHWKDWPRMPEYVQMQNRISTLMQGAVNETGLLVYYPLESFWSCFQPCFETITCYYKEGPAIEDAHAAKIDHDFQYLCSMLLNANYDFEILNSDAVDCFEVKEELLQNIHTGAKYSTIILPCVEYLPDKMVELLNAFTKAGGKVISYQSPLRYVLGSKGEHVWNPQELPHLQKEHFIKADSFDEVLELCKEQVKRTFRIVEGVSELNRTQMAYPARLHDPYLHKGEQQYGVGVVSYRKEGLRLLNMTNFNGQEEQITIEMESQESPLLFYPEDGKIVSVSLEMEAGKYRTEVLLPANRTVFLIGSV